MDTIPLVISLVLSASALGQVRKQKARRFEFRTLVVAMDKMFCTVEEGEAVILNRDMVEQRTTKLKEDYSILDDKGHLRLLPQGTEVKLIRTARFVDDPPMQLIRGMN